MELSVREDHVHLVVSIPPRLSVSEVMGYLKGKVAIKLFKSYPGLKRCPYWGNRFWSRGYCVSTIGMDEEKIRRYVKYQEDKERGRGQRERMAPFRGLIPKATCFAGGFFTSFSLPRRLYRGLRGRHRRHPPTQQSPLHPARLLSECCCFVFRPRRLAAAVPASLSAQIPGQQPVLHLRRLSNPLRLTVPRSHRPP